MEALVKKGLGPFYLARMNGWTCGAMASFGLSTRI